ncbi:unnamed protein product [Larinioides sclopetarius]|uniref:Reverse transcriptase Ty1/copia-type domain-containing protein n=1 Tax=Larinioides sclopetarius TaxID=280406 RepID=A0AAV2BA67_9ARAC
MDPEPFTELSNWNSFVQRHQRTILQRSISSIDKCLYKHTKNNKRAYVIVFVDDLLIGGEDQNIEKLILELKKEYPVTDLGDAKYDLGINIDIPDNNKMTIDQTNKIQELITKFGLENSKPTYTPMEPGYIKTIDNDNLLKNDVKYRQAVGALLYISTVTRPDISAAVNILSRRNEKPRAKDWEAVKRTIRYLKTTINLKLTFNITYADTD